MGNRGVLHNESNQIVKPWAHKSWVACLLSYKSIKRPKPFSKGNYSELFFLDEATAFSAGHRPCSYCQRERYIAFKSTWLQGNMEEPARQSALMSEIDKILHSERAIKGGGKQTFEAQLSELPSGSMFEHDGRAFLVSDLGHFPWSFDGYLSPLTLNRAKKVRVLTPQSVVKAFSAGFAPEVHQSANIQLKANVDATAAGRLTVS